MNYSDIEFPISGAGKPTVVAFAIIGQRPRSWRERLWSWPWCPWKSHMEDVLYVKWLDDKSHPKPHAD